MGKINWARVLLGGLVACVIINLVGAGLGSVLFTQGELQRAWTTVRPLEEWVSRTVALFVNIIVTLLAGTLIVWWYAAIRPRFGPGATTAVVAGAAFWLSASPVQVLVGGYLLQWPAHLLITVDAIHLTQCVAGAVAGAWAYRE